MRALRSRDVVARTKNRFHRRLEKINFASADQRHWTEGPIRTDTIIKICLIDRSVYSSIWGKRSSNGKASKNEIHFAIEYITVGAPGIRACSCAGCVSPIIFSQPYVWVYKSVRNWPLEWFINMKLNGLYNSQSIYLLSSDLFLFNIATNGLLHHGDHRRMPCQGSVIIGGCGFDFKSWTNLPAARCN